MWDVQPLPPQQLLPMQSEGQVMGWVSQHEQLLRQPQELQQEQQLLVQPLQGQRQRQEHLQQLGEQQPELQKVSAAIMDRQLLKEGEGVLVAVSGGKVRGQCGQGGCGRGFMGSFMLASVL